MPPHLKAVLSGVALIVCVTLFYYDYTHDGGAEKWVVLLLGPLMVVSIWIFPEANARDIRKDQAKRKSESAE